MSRTTSTQFDSGVLAIVHRAGGVSRVLIASARNGRPVIEEALELGASGTTVGSPALSGAPAGEDSGLAALLARHRVSKVIGVLPASSVVCRTCTLPNADFEQLDQALRLQAEAHFQASGHEYRTRMSVLPVAPGETSRSGIIVSWPESAAVPSMPGAAIPGRTITWAPDVAGLAALLDGQRPTEPLLWLDRPSGSVALALTHAGGATFRCTREEATTAEDWTKRVSRVLAETALSAGHTGGFAESIVRANESKIAAIGPGGAALLVSPELIEKASRRVEGARSDADWWSSFGVAVGVLLAATGDLAELTALNESAAIEKPSRIAAITSALSRPSTAVKAVIASIILFALTPPAMSRLRLAVLELRHSDIREQTRVLDATNEKLAMYRALNDQAFSVTKILSDIVTSTPRGIQLKSIRVQLSDRTFAVHGEAVPFENLSAPQVVALMQENLAASRLFSEIKLNWSDPNAYRTYKFELSAKVTAPHWRSPYPIELDYAKWPLVTREAGDGPPEEFDPAVRAANADGSAAALSADDGGDDPDGPPPGALAAGPGGTSPAAVRGEGPDRAGSGRSGSTPGGATARAGDAPSLAGGADSGSGDSTGSDGGDSGRARLRSGGPGDGPAGGLSGRGTIQGRTELSELDRGAIPPPVSEAQINAMTTAEVQQHLTKVAKAKNKLKRDDDPELFDRLKTEFDLLMKRMRENP